MSNNEVKKRSNTEFSSRFDGFSTSLLEIPCSILDIQKQSRGGAEDADVEISIAYWVFLLAGLNEKLLFVLCLFSCIS